MKGKMSECRREGGKKRRERKTQEKEYGITMDTKRERKKGKKKKVNEIARGGVFIKEDRQTERT